MTLGVGRAMTRRDHTFTGTPGLRLFVRGFCRAITRATGNTLDTETVATDAATPEVFWAESLVDVIEFD